MIPYLRNLAGLSREGRVRLFANLREALGLHGDLFRNDLGRRLAPGSPFFWYELALRDGERYHLFRFVVSDLPAVCGILRVEYVDGG